MPRKHYGPYRITAWALVDDKTGNAMLWADLYEIYEKRRNAVAMRGDGQRVIRVEIREVR